MPLLLPYPFPGENAKNPIELMRFARNAWRRLQKLRAGQFALTATVLAGTVGRAVLTDVSVGGTDTGIDNTVVGMWVSVTPPVSVPTGIQVDYAFCDTPGTLTVQVRNGTAGDLVVSGTWSYVGYTY